MLLFKENVIYFIASISIKHILSPCSSEKFKLVIEQDKVLMFFISKQNILRICSIYFFVISCYILTSFFICSWPPPPPYFFNKFESTTFMFKFWYKKSLSPNEEFFLENFTPFSYYLLIVEDLFLQTWKLFNQGCQVWLKLVI